MNSSAPGYAEANVKSTALAALFADGPRVAASDKAERRLNDWLAALEPEQGAALDDLLDRRFAKAILLGIIEFSPYLFDLMRADAARLIRLLECDPKAHLAALLEKTSRKVSAASAETEVMRLLRRMKAEAALLIALCDIGGVWPVMRVTAALTALADAAVGAAVHYLLADAARSGRYRPADPDAPERDSGYIIIAMGKMGAG